MTPAFASAAPAAATAAAASVIIAATAAAAAPTVAAAATAAEENDDKDNDPESAVIITSVAEHGVVPFSAPENIIFNHVCAANMIYFHTVYCSAVFPPRSCYNMPPFAYVLHNAALHSQGEN